MKWLFGQPTRGHWIPPKPSRVTSRGLAGSKGKDHRLVPTAKVEVSPELNLEVSPEVLLVPILKVIPKVTYETYALGPPMNLCPGEE